MMNNLFFLFLSVICVCFQSIWAEEAIDPYLPRIISIQIEQDPETKLVKGTIGLDNGSYWIWAPSCKCCHAKKLDTWKEGDSVYIVKRLNDEYLMFKDRVSPKFYGIHVRLAEGNQDLFPTIEEIHDGGQKLILSDGSEWYVGWWSARTVAYWKPGDHVLIIPECLNIPFVNEATHMISNMNREKTLINDISFIHATKLN